MGDNKTVAISFIVMSGFGIFVYAGYFYYKSKGMLNSDLNNGGVKYFGVIYVMIKDISNRWKVWKGRQK